MSKTREPETIKSLDAALPRGCEMPGCDCGNKPLTEFFFHPSCHPPSPTWVRYDATTKLLELTCATCRRFICFIAVKPE